MSDCPILIVGAGPTGLSAALFLSHLGVTSRIVERRSAPSTTSNALAVNPRTLALLEPTGVAAAITAEGLQLDRARVHQDGREIGVLDLDLAEIGEPRRMTILPQWRTEALLADALAARGIVAERGLELTAVNQDDAGVSATFSAADGSSPTIRTPLLFAADGAHSFVRHALGLGFDGSTFPEPWRVVDIELAAPQATDAHIDFRRTGPLLAFPYSPTHWRLIGVQPDIAQRLPSGWRLGEVRWSSDFRLSHRIASRLTVGRICLGGDAAHIHAPVGGRGMNLGIEDAWVFAQIAAQALAGDMGRVADYGRIRRGTDATVVRRIEAITRAMGSNGPFARALRPGLLPLLLGAPPLRRAAKRMMTGLEHPLRLS